MGPKIQAAIDFLEHQGKECIITSVESVASAVTGKGGTHIVAR
jgi:carbamate kinase